MTSIERAAAAELHIDSELLLKEKYWLKLYQEVQKFLILGKLVGHVYA